MSGVFRPIINKGKGFIPDLTVKYIVGGAEIRKFSGFFNSKVAGQQRINETTQTQKATQKLWHKIRDIADVRVTSDGGTITYERIRPAGAFVRAVEAEKARILEVRAARNSTNDETKPNKERQDIELSSAVLVIPRMPKSIESFLKERFPRGQYNQCLVKVGEFVDENQRLITFGKADQHHYDVGKSESIRSPVSGKIIAVGTDGVSPLIKIQISQDFLNRNPHILTHPDSDTIIGSAFSDLGNVLSWMPEYKDAQENWSVSGDYTGKEIYESVEGLVSRDGKPRDLIEFLDGKTFEDYALNASKPEDPGVS